MASAKKELILNKTRRFLVSFQDSPAYEGTFGQNFYKVSQTTDIGIIILVDWNFWKLIG